MTPEEKELCFKERRYLSAKMNACFLVNMFTSSPFRMGYQLTELPEDAECTSVYCPGMADELVFHFIHPSFEPVPWEQSFPIIFPRIWMTPVILELYPKEHLKLLSTDKLQEVKEKVTQALDERRE